MSPFVRALVRNTLAVVAGYIVGSIVNMTLIIGGMFVIPLPQGASLDELDKAMELFTAKHFITPLLAHSLGAFVGAFIAAWLAVSHRMIMGLCVATFFLLGGGYMIWMYGGPWWFIAADLGSYIPMGLLGGGLVAKLTTKTE